MKKRTILALLRASPPYLDLLEALDRSGKYRLIVDSNMAAKLSERGVECDIWEDFINDKVNYWVNKTMPNLAKKLANVFQKENFQQLFLFENKPFFQDIAESTFQNLIRQFSEEVFLIEVFRNLQKQFDISLVLVWTDVLRQLKAFTFAAQAANIPVLQLLHGGFNNYFVGHYENQIYSDKLANIADYSKDFFHFYGRDTGKCVPTGRIEFDYPAARRHDSRNEMCIKLGLDPHKPIVVFGTTWTFPHSAWYYDSRKNIGDTYAAFTKAFAKLKKKHPDLQLLVKVHPEIREPYTPAFFQETAAQAGIDNAIVTAEHLQESLAVCDVLVTFKSTICVDAVLLDKPVIVLNFQPTSDRLFYSDHAFHYVRNPEDTYKAIENALFNDCFRQELEQKREHSKKYFNYLNDGKALDRIVALIDEMSNDSSQSNS